MVADRGRVATSVGRVAGLVELRRGLVEQSGDFRLATPVLAAVAAGESSDLSRWVVAVLDACLLPPGQPRSSLDAVQLTPVQALGPSVDLASSQLLGGCLQLDVVGWIRGSSRRLARDGNKDRTAKAERAQCQQTNDAADDDLDGERGSLRRRGLSAIR